MAHTIEQEAIKKANLQELLITNIENVRRRIQLDTVSQTRLTNTNVSIQLEYFKHQCQQATVASHKASCLEQVQKIRAELEENILNIQNENQEVVKSKRCLNDLETMIRENVLPYSTFKKNFSRNFQNKLSQADIHKSEDFAEISNFIKEKCDEKLVAYNNHCQSIDAIFESVSG